MDNALVVSSNDKGTQMLTEMLLQAQVSRVVSVSTGEEARRGLIDAEESEFEMCVINAPLSDEFGDLLARNIVAKSGSEVILIVRADIFSDMSEKMGEHGVITVSKPMNKALFWNAVKMSEAAHKRLQIIRRENKRLQKKIDDIRVIDRAKCMLIAYLSMTEPEAHKYIEKQAMDTRATRRAVAEDILKTYES